MCKALDMPCGRKGIYVISMRSKNIEKHPIHGKFRVLGALTYLLKNASASVKMRLESANSVSSRAFSKGARV